MIAINPNRTDTLINALTALWEASVRATHHFLTEDDIQRIKPFVKTGLSDIETLIVMSDTHHPVAFIGIEADKIEMLFVSSNYFRKGIGKELATLAITQYKVLYVNVNEQNPQATGFYRHIGFQEYERTELDEQCNPFPILKMKLPPFYIRQSTPDDILDLKKLYQDTVLTVNRHDYSQEEVEDRASCGEDLSNIRDIIKTHYFRVSLR